MRLREYLDAATVLDNVTESRLKIWWASASDIDG